MIVLCDDIVAGRDQPGANAVLMQLSLSISRQDDCRLGHTVVQKIPGIGPTLGAVLVAEIGDITRFASASKLTCWAGLTPKHHESDTHAHRGGITKQDSGLAGWAATGSVKTISKTSGVGDGLDRLDRRP